jgi:hypothetical protein
MEHCPNCDSLTINRFRILFWPYRCSSCGAKICLRGTKPGQIVFWPSFLVGLIMVNLKSSLLLAIVLSMAMLAIGLCPKLYVPSVHRSPDAKVYEGVTMVGKDNLREWLPIMVFLILIVMLILLWPLFL